MNEEKTKEIDELINCLDDLPHLMDKIKAETANTTRYSSKNFLPPFLADD